MVIFVISLTFYILHILSVVRSNVSSIHVKQQTRCCCPNDFPKVTRARYCKHPKSHHGTFIAIRILHGRGERKTLPPLCNLMYLVIL